MSPKLITRLFLAAGLTNLSVLVFSKFFTNEVLTEYDPVVLSDFGVLMIVLWGLAYMAVARNYAHVKWLVGVFAVEKFVYGYTWTKWITTHDVSAVYDKDLLAGIFYSIYGIGDMAFGLFFLVVFIQLLKQGRGVGN